MLSPLPCLHLCNVAKAWYLSQTSLNCLVSWLLNSGQVMSHSSVICLLSWMRQTIHTNTTKSQDRQMTDSREYKHNNTNGRHACTIASCSLSLIEIWHQFISILLLNTHTYTHQLDCYTLFNFLASTQNFHNSLLYLLGQEYNDVHIANLQQSSVHTTSFHSTHDITTWKNVHHSAYMTSQLQVVFSTL